MKEENVGRERWGDEKEKKIDEGRGHISCQYKQSSRCTRKGRFEIIGIGWGVPSRRYLLYYIE
jgi:hypothetical protein